MILKLFGCVLGVCMAMQGIAGEIMRLDERMPEEESVHVMSLGNGITLFVQDTGAFSSGASLRVVAKTHSSEEKQYTYNGSIHSLEGIEHFFLSCKNRLPVDFPSGMKEVAVVVVGDIAADHILPLVQEHLHPLPVADQDLFESGRIQSATDGAHSKGLLRLSYAPIRPSITTYRDLQDSLKGMLLQELLQQRLERCVKGMKEAWVRPHPYFFIPVNGYALAEDPETLLWLLLRQVEAIRTRGWEEEEFQSVKGKMMDRFASLASHAQSGDAAFFASYCSAQFVLCGRCLCCRTFFNAAEQLLSSVEASDLEPYFSSYLADENRLIQLVYPQPAHPGDLTLEKGRKNQDIAGESLWMWDTESDGGALMHLTNPFAEPLFQFANNTVSAPGDASSDFLAPFFQLGLTDKEKRFITIIISTMAAKNILQLAFEKHSLESKGDKIRHVHPMRFIGYIISCSDLKSDLRVIKKSSFKWDAFIDGFSKRMKEEFHRGNIYPHVPGFASQVGATQEEINHYIAKKDWEGLVKFLIGT